MEEQVQVKSKLNEAWEKRGVVRLWLNTVTFFKSWIMGTMTLVGVLRLSNMGWWEIVLLFAGVTLVVVLLVWLYMKFMFSEVLDENAKKNPMMMKLVGMVEELTKKVDKLKRDAE